MQPELTKPNLLIISAREGGTTWLHYRLALRPNKFKVRFFANGRGGYAEFTAGSE